MLLSEAIRLGAMSEPQCYGAFYDDLGGSCALGAAGTAVGDTFVDLMETTKHWPWLGRWVECPEYELCGNRAEACEVIGHLNDDHRWTRERIADWVATIEPPTIEAESTVVCLDHEPSHAVLCLD